MENNDIDVEMAIKELCKRLRAYRDSGEKYITADCLVAELVSIMKPDIHPDEYIHDGTVAIPFELLDIDE